MRDDDDYRILWRDDEPTPSAAELKAGRASTYIQRLKLRPGQLCVAWCRESTPSQAGNMPGQVASVRHKIECAGGKVVDVFDRIVSGKKLEQLSAVAKFAKRIGAVLVAESTCRFIRNKYFNPKRFPNVRPTDEELQGLIRATRGVPLMTILHPDLPLNKVRKYQAKRNRRFKGRKARGGRPVVKRPGYKVNRRQQMEPQVLELAQRGWTVRRIETKTGIPYATVHRWLAEYQREKA